MEQDTAILIADLSGYTALTETHGSSTAANTVDKFLNIVKDCLVGKSIFHQSVGDEVMLVSNSPDDLLNTAITLMQNCSEENLFLQVHGGLHYGKVLKHNSHYFGSPVNYASRIAAKADNGTLWCSSSFINALSNPSEYLFRSKGEHNFKNVTEKIEVSELLLETTNSFQIDPVCRMIIDKKAAIHHPHYNNVTFCSAGCLEIYDTNKSL